MIPPELVQLGVVGIVALALWGVVQAIKPLIVAFVANQKELATVNRELLTALRASDRAQDRNAAETKALRVELMTANAEERDAHKAQNEALTALAKALPDMFAGVVHGNEAQLARLDAHDTQAREGIARIETAIAALRDEIRAGHKAQRQEVLDKLDHVLAEIRALQPTPPPPKVLPPPEKLEEKAA